jgi:hypothetical protein
MTVRQNAAKIDLGWFRPRLRLVRPDESVLMSGPNRARVAHNTEEREP